MNLQQWRKKRPNKMAAGMNYTTRRSRHHVSEEVNTLIVRGTLDKTGRGNWMFIRPSECKCCGAKTGPKVLSDKGRNKLSRMREQRSN